MDMDILRLVVDLLVDVYDQLVLVVEVVGLYWGVVDG